MNAKLSIVGQIAKALLTIGAMSEESLNDHLAENTDIGEWIDFGFTELDFFYENGFATVTDDAKLALTDAGRKYYTRICKLA